MDEEEHSLYWLVGHLCELNREFQQDPATGIQGDLRDCRSLVSASLMSRFLRQ